MGGQERWVVVGGALEVRATPDIVITVCGVVAVRVLPADVERVKITLAVVACVLEGLGSLGSGRGEKFSCEGLILYGSLCVITGQNDVIHIIRARSRCKRVRQHVLKAKKYGEVIRYRDGAIRLRDIMIHSKYITCVLGHAYSLSVVCAVNTRTVCQELATADRL